MSGSGLPIAGSACGWSEREARQSHAALSRLSLGGSKLERRNARKKLVRILSVSPLAAPNDE